MADAKKNRSRIALSMSCNVVVKRTPRIVLVRRRPVDACWEHAAEPAGPGRLMFEVATVKKYMANVHEVSFPEVLGSSVSMLHTSHYSCEEDLFGTEAAQVNNALDAEALVGPVDPDDHPEFIGAQQNRHSEAPAYAASRPVKARPAVCVCVCCSNLCL